MNHPGTRRFLVLSALVVSGALSVHAAGTAASIVPARIVEVTVFADRAEVTREGKIDLAAGAATLTFEGLPWNVEPDSLRVTAKGTPASLGAVELKERVATPSESAEYLAAKDEVERIEKAQRSLVAEGKTDESLREFLNALKATTAARESEKMGEGKADPVSIQAAYALLRDGLGDLAVKGVSREDRRMKLAKDFELAKAKLGNLRPASPIHSRAAVVEVACERPGPLTVRLSYLAPGASWRPAYRASLDAATGEIALGSEAVVRQNSGEDWSGVALRLSTAAPARGVTPPWLESWLLRPVEVMARSRMESGYRFDAGNTVEPEDAPMSKAVSGFVQAHDAQEADAERQEAAVVHSAYNVAFEVPGRSDVLADGEDHRVGLRQETLKGKIEYRSVPGVNEAAFLVAKSSAPSGYPLLAGPVRVFVSGAYLGAFALAETGPGAEVTLPFGIDNRVKVERTPLPQARSEEGFIGKDRRLAFSFRTVVENLRDTAVTVIVEDRLPVSEDERISVERGKGTTPGARDVAYRPGIVEWTLTLGPKEKKEVVFEYAVRFPKDLFIPGLE